MGFEVKQSVLVLGLLLYASNLWANSWLDDWVVSKTTTTSGNYHGQTRGYFSGGSFQARWPMSNERLINFQPPRIASGCGGIDLFGGGLSFLDADRLVQKLQSVLQAAPAVAFDMALKTMCKECSDTVRTLEAMANDLNSLVQSDCQMAKSLAAKVMPDVPEDNALNTVAATLNQKLGNVRDYYEHEENTTAANGNPGVDMRLATDSCSNDFKAIFAEGSLIQRIADDLAFTDYADLLRGLVGDVNIRFNTTLSMYDMDTIPPCRTNRAYSLDDFMTGHVQERPLGGVCRDNTTQNFTTYVRTTLDAIGTKMTQGTPALTADEIAFIDSAPIPVEKTLRVGAMTNNLPGALGFLQDALSAAYAYRAIDDLYNSLQYLIQHANTAAQKAGGPSGDPNLCNPIVFAPAIKQVNAWAKEVRHMQIEAKNSYRTEIENLANFNVMIRSLMEQYRTAEHNSLGPLEP